MVLISKFSVFGTDVISMTKKLKNKFKKKTVKIFKGSLLLLVSKFYRPNSYHSFRDHIGTDKT